MRTTVAPRLATSPITRRSIAISLASLAVAAAMPSLGRTAEAAGQVILAKGRSTGLLEGSLRDLAVGASVFLSELIQTGRAARLRMDLGRNTHVRLGERTRLKIDKSIVEHGGEVTLERGALLFHRPDHGDRPDVFVRTPFASIAARGTRFFVGPSNNVVGVFVERGLVDVANYAGAVRLRAGQGTNLTSANVAPTPPTAWGAPRIRAAMASVS